MRLLIAVKTCHVLDYFVDDQTTDWLNSQGLRFMNPEQRVAAQRKTWLSPEGIERGLRVLRSKFTSCADPAGLGTEIDYKFFYGSKLRRTDIKPNQRPGTEKPAPPLRTPETDEVFLTCGDNYTQNSAKVKEILRYARQHGFDYVLLVDDDTFVYLDRLLATDWDTAEYSGATTETFHPGSCVFLSAAAMDVLIKSRITSYCDDLWIGQALEAAKIGPNSIPVIRHGFGNEYPVRFASQKVVDAYAALHSCRPDIMRALWTLRTIVSSVPQKDTDGQVSKTMPSLSPSLVFADAKSSSVVTSPTSPKTLSSDSGSSASSTSQLPETPFTNVSAFSAIGSQPTSQDFDSSSTATSGTL